MMLGTWPIWLPCLFAPVSWHTVPLISRARGGPTMVTTMMTFWLASGDLIIVWITLQRTAIQPSRGRGPAISAASIKKKRRILSGCVVSVACLFARSIVIAVKLVKRNIYIQKMSTLDVVFLFADPTNSSCQITWSFTGGQGAGLLSRRARIKWPHPPPTAGRRTNKFVFYVIVVKLACCFRWAGYFINDLCCCFVVV